MATPILMCWSGGKDSARTLHELRADPTVQVVGLLTTLTIEFDRVSMHGIRRELAVAQARAAGLPIAFVEIPSPCSNAVYEAAMERALAPWIESGVRHVAFGDIFLEDLRRYREEKLARSGLTGVFPIFGRSTRDLAREHVELGFGAVVTCLDPRVMPKQFAGRELDLAFFAELPPNVDPCGENGEFHTFVHAGPIFREPIPIQVGATVEREGFVFTDVLPAE